MFTSSKATVLMAGLMLGSGALHTARAQGTFDLDTLPRCVAVCISDVITATGCSIDNPPCVCVDSSFYQCQVKSCPAEVQNSQTVEKVTAWCASGNQSPDITGTGFSLSSTIDSFTIQTETIVTNPSGSATATAPLTSVTSVSSATAPLTSVTSVSSVLGTGTSTRSGSSTVSQAPVSSSPSSGTSIKLFDGAGAATMGLMAGVAVLGGWLALF